MECGARSLGCGYRRWGFFQRPRPASGLPSLCTHIGKVLEEGVRMGDSLQIIIFPNVQPHGLSKDQFSIYSLIEFSRPN